MKMGEAKMGLLILKGAITDLPLDEQVSVKSCADVLRASIKAHGDTGRIALALVGLELGVAEEEKGS
jgi:hypothetical protein